MLRVSLLTLVSSSAHANSSELLTFQKNAPADTTFYFDGLLDSKAAPVVPSLRIYNLQFELLLAQLEAISADEYSDEIAFLMILFREGLAAQAGGYHSLRHYYGLNDSLASAVYLDGLIPVIQLAVDDKQSLIKRLSTASEQSGVMHKTKMWGRHAVDYWVLKTKKDLGFDLWLTLATKGRVTSIAIMPAQLSQARRLDVLGLLPEAYSLAESQGMAQVRQSENFLDYTAGFVSLLEIARLIADPRSNKAGEDLITLFGLEVLPKSSVACLREWLELARNIPKLVIGYDRLELQSQSATAEGHMLLQLKDPKITQALQQLNGNLPNYSLSAQDALISIAFGINMSALVPVFSQLRMQALSARFECGELITAQNGLMSSDFSALMIAAATGQGVSGVGAALYDIDLSNIANGNFALDALLSVTSDHPRLLSNLVSFVPQLQFIQVPTDGSSVALDLPDLPKGLKPRLATKGQHLVVFDGPKATETAQKLEFEQPNTRGILSTTVNYKKLGQMASDAMDMVDNMKSNAARECAELSVIMTMLNETTSEVSIRTSVEDNGIRFDFSAQVAIPNDSSSRSLKPGRYQLEMLVDGCNWLPVGSQTVRPNGTGQYQKNNESGRCVLRRAQYNWQQHGRRISFNETELLSRNTCDENLQSVEANTSSCILLTVSSKGFDCLFNYTGQDKEIYRFVLSQ